jgi:hypothetical protein
MQLIYLHDLCKICIYVQGKGSGNDSLTNFQGDMEIRACFFQRKRFSHLSGADALFTVKKEDWSASGSNRTASCFLAICTWAWEVKTGIWNSNWEIKIMRQVILGRTAIQSMHYTNCFQEYSARAKKCSASAASKVTPVLFRVLLHYRFQDWYPFERV